MPLTRGQFGVSSTVTRAAWIALCVLCAQPAAATPPLAVQRYSLEEGLSQQAVNAITQDADGFMWFGTEDGLNRFDGYEFRQLRHDRANDARCPTAGSPRWWRVTTVCGSRPTAVVCSSAARRPASCPHQTRCTTRPTCSACARWRATAWDESGLHRARQASPSSIRAAASCSACGTRPPSRSRCQTTRYSASCRCAAATS